jgi:hypothetical protein
LIGCLFLTFLLLARLNADALLPLLILKRFHLLLMPLLQLGSLRRPGRLLHLLLMFRLQRGSLLEMPRVELGPFLQMPGIQRRSCLGAAGRDLWGRWRRGWSSDRSI